MDPSDIQKAIESAVASALTQQAAVMNTALKAQASEQLKQMSDFQISMEDKFSQLSQTLPAQTLPNITVKKEPKANADTLSENSSSTSDVEFIRGYIKPVFTNQDAAIKHSQDRLFRLQSKLESQIPKLAYDKPVSATSGDQTDPSTASTLLEPPTHNYLKWLKALLKYFKSLSPALADETERFLNQLNVDDFIHGKSPVNYPQLDDDDYPDLVKVSAMTAITATVSSDFSHLIDGDTMIDIFPSLVNLHCTCRPNSDDDRAEELISFWDLRMNDTETVSFFGNRLRDASKAFNSASPHDKISPPQLAAALKNGIKKGAQSERFAHALLTMKYKIKNPPYDSMLLWLDQNCDRTKPVTKSVVPASSASRGGQQASAVRTRGGKGGGRGRGGASRGGKGARAGKGGKGDAVRADDNGSVVWNQTYYKVEDDDGNDTITKEVKDHRSKRPCFTKFEDGACHEPDCPYSHDFNVADRTSAPRQPRPAKSSSAAPPAPSEPSEDKNSSSSSAAGQISDSEEDGFQYVYDLGFQSASSCASVSPPALSLKNLSIFALLVFSSLLFSAFGLINWTHVLDHKTIAAMSLLLLSATLCFPMLAQMTARTFRYTSSAAAAFWTRAFKAKYQTILDCGCTFTMSGDLSIFDPSSLVKITENVGLAESGYAVNATHFGKACIGGRLIDSLYVPSFRQTMVSMGQLEKMGLIYSVVGNTRNFLTPNKSIFLSFSLAANNLYFLSSSSSSHSSSSASL